MTRKNKYELYTTLLFLYIFLVMPFIMSTMEMKKVSEMTSMFVFAGFAISAGILIWVVAWCNQSTNSKKNSDKRNQIIYLI